MGLYIYIYATPPHVPTLFGLETLEHGFFEAERAYRFQDSPHLCSQPEPCGQLMESPTQRIKDSGVASTQILEGMHMNELNSIQEKPRIKDSRRTSNQISKGIHINQVPIQNMIVPNPEVQTSCVISI